MSEAIGDVVNNQLAEIILNVIENRDFHEFYNTRFEEYMNGEPERREEMIGDIKDFIK